jgi:acyl phosphate:glycerol-3-phosphate acyltransferase
MSDTVWMWAALAIAGAYLLGSIPFGLILARARGVDVRAAGSGNIGATNVARTVGRKLGVVVLLLDALKGMGPMAAILYSGLGAETSPYVNTAVGLAAIVGHCFPVWLRFRGGKGVATSLGVFVIVDPLATGIGAAVWIALYAAFRISSVGSLAAAVAIPSALFLLGHPPWAVALGIGGAFVVIVKHQGNIRRLLGRAELKV